MLQIIEKKKVANSKDVANCFIAVLNLRQEEDRHKEYFYTMGLDSQNTVLFIDLTAIGTVNQCHPIIRECLRTAIIKNAVSIIICHNHPSGDPAPSPQDTTFTEKLKKAGEILNVKLLDHIIIGVNFYSYSDNQAV